jgi:outer membrane protein
MYKNIKLNLIILIIFLSNIFFIHAEEITLKNNNSFMERNLSLERCIELALLNNRTLLAAREELEITRQKAKEAIAFIYPQVDFNGSYSKYKLDSLYFVSNPKFGYNLLSNQFENYYTGRLSLYQLIYAGRKFKNTKKSSNISIKRAKSEYERIRYDVIYKAKINFYKYIYDDNLVKYLSSKKAYLEKMANTYIYPNSKSYVYDFEKYKKYLDNKIENYSLDRDVAKLELFSVIGIDFNTVAEIDGVLKIEDGIKYDLNTCITRALQLRPELLQSEAQEELGALEMNISLSEKTPVVALNANYQYANNIFKIASDEHWNADWDVTLNVTFPIFDGGAWLARNKQKKSDLRKSKIKTADLEEDIKMEIQVAYLQYISVKKKFDNTENIEENSSKNYSSWLDLFSAEKDVIDNKITYLDALYEYNIALEKLKFVIGEP